MVPSLPQHDPHPDRRRRQLADAREELSYAWDRPPGVAAAAKVPRRLGFPAAVVLQVTEARAALAANRVARRVVDGAEDPAAPSTSASCRAAFATLALPRVAQVADADRLFGWYRVAGPDPFVLARADRVPDGVPVPDAPLFVADYRLLDGLPAGSWNGVAKRIAAPTAWFVSGADGLRPVAIRVDGRLLVPGDGLAWELARATVQAADANVHESFFHLGRAHFLLEAVGLATERRLASAHPLFVLLAPHLEGTLAINGSARDELVAPGGQLDQLMAPTLEGSLALVRRALETFRLEEALPPADLARRGVDDPELLPTFPWRDDALPIWRAIRAWVGAYLALAYATPADLQGDVELAAWVEELRSPDGGRLGGFPVPETVEALADAVAFVIFQASAGHAAVNYSQEDFQAYAPAMPTATYGEGSWEALLPPRGQADAQLEFMVQQSRVRVNRLGRYPRFADPRVAGPLAAFQRELDAVERAIDLREAARFLPYPYLRPSLLTASIHI